MTTNDIAVPAAAAQPDRVGQATAVEQSRAIAEVQGAILVAQRCPRDVSGAVTAMRESCGQPGLANRAFFRFPRSGSTVTGPSVYLARELARTWGNVQYGVSEMRRDDGHGQSEMLAYAWDVQTNTRVETKFVVPHMRDKRGGPERLTDMRDIYENNANAGARRVRECIFSILPPWFVEEAKDRCNKTLAEASDKPLHQRIADAVGLFEAVGISRDQLERKIERPTSKWTVHDVVQLGVVYKSLQNGEVRKEDEFPPERLSADDLGDAPSEPTPAAEPAKPAERKVSQPQSTKLHAALNSCGITKRPDVIDVLSKVVGRPIGSSSELTAAEASRLLDDLDGCVSSDNPGAALDLYLENFQPPAEAVTA